MTFHIGETAGHHLRPADMTVAKHVTCRGVHGYLVSRKRLRDRAAFNRDPTQGWEIDRWFEWPNGEPFGKATP